MIKIVQILTYLSSGGAEMVVYNYLSHMDKRNMQIDIVAISSNENQFAENKFREMGLNIYFLPKNPLKRLVVFNRLLQENKYDIVHSHCEFLSELYLLLAAVHGVKKRIMHSHIANAHLPIIKRLYQPFGHFIAQLSATNYFACGKAAAVSLWGIDNFDRGRCYIMNNAVDLQKFAFSKEKHDSIRKRMGWDGKFVIINVASLSYQKNSLFLIDIFYELMKKKSDLLLVQVGAGNLLKEVEERVKIYDIEQQVQLLGRRDDIPELLNGADVFLLPSRYEGLPVVSIEAQANGLPIVMSDSITHECGLVNIASFITLSAPIDTWISAILKNHQQDRTAYTQILRNKGFDISIEADNLRKFYEY